MAKNFSWSYSKTKAYDNCPKRFYEIDIQKNYTDSSDELLWGNVVHKALADACMGTVPLPDNMKSYQPWVTKYADPSLPGELFVERQYAMTKDFQPTQWRDWDGAWLRAVVDLLRVNGPVARAVDWKTGKMLHDSRQLMISSQLIFVHHPEVQRIKTEFVWLKEGHMDAVTVETFDRDTIVNHWPPVLEQVKQMEEAAKTLNYPPKPGRLCARYCPVTSCPYHGKR